MYKHIFSLVTLLATLSAYCSQAPQNAPQPPPALNLNTQPEPQPIPVCAQTLTQQQSELDSITALPQLPRRNRRRPKYVPHNDEDAKRFAETDGPPCELSEAHNLELLRKTAQCTRAEQTAYHAQKLVTLSAVVEKLESIAKLSEAILAEQQATSAALVEFFKQFGTIAEQNQRQMAAHVAITPYITQYQQAPAYAMPGAQAHAAAQPMYFAVPLPYSQPQTANAATAAAAQPHQHYQQPNQNAANASAAAQPAHYHYVAQPNQHPQQLAQNAASAAAAAVQPTPPAAGKK